MSEDNPSTDLARRFYLEPAAAFVRPALPEAPEGTAEELVQLGLRAGLRLHRFKRTADLPRVRKVLGILRGLGPESILDIGSGPLLSRSCKEGLNSLFQKNESGARSRGT